MPPPNPAGLSEALDSRRSKGTIRRLTIAPPNSVDFSSNDFLSLAQSRKLRELFLEEFEHISSSPRFLGSGGSRLLDGNSHYATTLEQDIARFHLSESGLLCNSGYDANVGIFSCLPQPGDTVIYDSLIHASCHDGMRMSRAKQCLSFLHNDVEDLEHVLQRCVAADTNVRNGKSNVWLAVESVYSMDGDVAPLRNMVDLVEATLPAGNGHLIVDEAHSTGVYGDRGRGLVCALGLQKRVTVRLYTFGKALSAHGSIICADSVTRQYLLNYARPLIYSTFMPYYGLAGIRASYRLLESGYTEPLQAHLKSLIGFLYEQLRAVETRFRLQNHELHLFRIPQQRPQSAISWVMSSRPKDLAAYLQERGSLVRAILPPTVPLGSERIRIVFHAGNTTDEVIALVRGIASWITEVRSSSQNVARAKL